MASDSSATLTEILNNVRRIELVTRGIVRESIGGEYLSTFKGQGIDFDDFREYQPGDEVDLIIFGKTQLGYKAVVNGSHSGLLFSEGVFQELQPGERCKGYIAVVREDGKIDLSLHAPGRTKVTSLEETILIELKARGGSWTLGDHSPAAEIHDELGVSKRTFKQALGSLLKKGEIQIGERGIRLVDPEG